MLLASLILNIWLIPTLLAKKWVIKKPYYSVSLVVSVTMGFLGWLFLLRGHAVLTTIFFVLYVFGPTAAVYITDMVVVVKDSKQYEEKRDFSKVYNMSNVYTRMIFKIEDEGIGIVRFGMEDVSAKICSEHAAPLPTQQYTRPLKSESELKDLTDDFAYSYRAFNRDLGNSELQLANEIWHDEDGAYRLLLVLAKDDHGDVYLRNVADIYRLYIKPDTNPYQDRSFTVI